MKSYRILTLICCLWAVTGLRAASIDPDVRVGNLPNGLTYYIEHNESPKGMADFFLAQKVGSINEAENQRGLAHFLEHMCFNGTEHFPGKGLINYLESNGVKFGANLNAYTSTDETVYNICKVPTARESLVDSTLLILRDWCDGITLDADEIDAERGVIVNEWRQRNTAANRMLERALEEIYGDNPYGHRMPIGKMEVVENFTPDVLRDYYKTWYISANQCVVVVGDIDVDKVENAIKKTFGNIPAKRTADSKVSTLPALPFNDDLIVAVESDSEQGAQMLQMYFRMPQGDNEIEHAALADMAATLLTPRYDAMEASADCPHTSLGIGEVNFFLSRGQKALTLRGMSRPGRVADAVEEWTAELLRAAQLGFDENEMEVARKSVYASLDERARREATPNNTFLAKNAVRHYLDGGDVISADDRRAAIRKAVEKMTSEDVQRYIASAVNTSGKGAVVLHYRPESDETDAQVADKIRAQFSRLATRKYEPFVAPQTGGDILASEPTPGSIIAKEDMPIFDATLYTLSNGIKVLAKKTDFKADQIYVRGYSEGGTSQMYTPEDAPTIRVIDAIIAEMGYGNHSAADLRRVLSDRNIKVSTSTGHSEESIEAATNRRDMQDAFRLLYLRATGIEPDSIAFETYIANRRNVAANTHLNPIQAMGDTIHFNIYNRHPLAQHPSLADIDHISMQKAIDIYKDRYADMSDFTFMVVGDFNSDSLEMCLRDYIAALPGGGRKEKAKDIGYSFNPTDVNIHFARKMERPQPVVYLFYSAPVDYTLPNVLNSIVFGNILRTRLMNDLREERGWTYSVKAHASINTALAQPSLIMPIYIKSTPGKEEEVAKVISETVQAMATTNPPTEAEVNGIKEYMAKHFSESAADNAYWLKVFKGYLRDGVDLHNPYLKDVEAITPQSVQAFAQEVLPRATKATLIMSAEE